MRLEAGAILEMGLFGALLAAGLLGCSGPSPQPGCGSDNDCRAPRVCNLGSCVDPVGAGGTTGAGSLGCGVVDIGCNCNTLDPSIHEGTILNAPRCQSGQHVFRSCGTQCGGGGSSWRTECTCPGGTSGGTSGTTGTSSSGGTTGGASGACTELTLQRWTGSQPCYPIGSYAQTVTDELETIWRTGPALVCAYAPNALPTTACGPAQPNNAFYCGGDDSVSWDTNFLNTLYANQGDFASVVVIAHEWGHLNQQRAGLLGAPNRVQLQNELHADCQAGIFAAVEEARGLLSPGDLSEAFRSLCSAGDPGWGWFNPNGHGSCTDRENAFGWGYNQAKSQLASVCGSQPHQAMLQICAN